MVPDHLRQIGEVVAAVIGAYVVIRGIVNLVGLSTPGARTSPRRVGVTWRDGAEGLRSVAVDDDSRADGRGTTPSPGHPGAQVPLPPEQPGSRVVLSAAQLAVLGRYGHEREAALGDVLFRDGDETYDLVVLLKGEVRIVEHHAQPDEFVIVTYGPGEFMGEIGLLTGQRAYLTAVVSAPGLVLRIAVEQVHAIMDQELELSELILRAFLVRHSRLTRLGSGLTLVGSRFDADTRRLLEVLSRNRLSFRWLELEARARGRGTPPTAPRAACGPADRCGPRW